MDRFLYKRAAGITVLSAAMSDFSYKPHAHAEYAIGVTESGVQQYHLNGALYSSYPGGVMRFSPEQTHDGNAGDRSGIRYVMLYVPAGLVNEITGQREMREFHKPIVYNPFLAGNILELSAGVFADTDEALLVERVMAIAEEAFMVDVVPAKAKPPDFTKAVQIMHESTDITLKLDEICHELQLSKYHFIRSFKKSMGISPYQYYLNCKLERAKVLLDQGEDVYRAVCDCGFFDLAHLNRHFKQVYGVTAYQYRQCMKQTG